ncbi:MAG: peptidylprolyl isomerase [Micavibrio sp.]
MRLIKAVYSLAPLLVSALTLAAAPFAAAPAYAQKVAGIAAVVNDEAISMGDVTDRMKLVIISSGLPNNEEIRNRILPQLLEGLIEEQIKMQEAKRHNVGVSDEEIAEALDVIAQQNNLTGEKFAAALKQSGVPVATLTRQIRAQLMWNNYVRQVIHPRIKVSESDTKARLERVRAKIGQTEYLAAEIYLPFEDSKRAGELEQFARRMATELQAKKAPFGAVAAQFSKAAGAEKGGVLGWVQEGQLAPALESALFKLEEGGVTNPIKTPDGIHILQLQKKRTLTEDSIPSRDEITNSIGYERLDRAQQKALVDLKSAAFIDRRI